MNVSRRDVFFTRAVMSPSRIIDRTVIDVANQRQGLRPV